MMQIETKEYAAGYIATLSCTELPFKFLAPGATKDDAESNVLEDATAYLSTKRLKDITIVK